MSVEMNVYVRKRIRLLKVVISLLRRFVNQVSAEKRVAYVTQYQIWL